MLDPCMRNRAPNAEVRRSEEYLTFFIQTSHVAGINHGKWTEKITESRPRDYALCSIGRPPTRLSEDLKQIHPNQMNAAWDREKWKYLQEAYDQQWTTAQLFVDDDDDDQFSQLAETLYKMHSNVQPK